MSASHQNPHTDEAVVPVPQVGDPAPTLGKDVHFPSDKPVMVVFLRHCGCPCKSASNDTFHFQDPFSTQPISNPRGAAL